MPPRYYTITPQEFVKGQTIVCPECGDHFYRQEMLDDHMKDEHSKGK